MSIQDVSDGDFQSVVLEAELPVVVDVWAAWCGPCKALTPVLEKIAAEYADKGVVLSKVNVDEEMMRVLMVNNPMWVQDLCKKSGVKLA